MSSSAVHLCINWNFLFKASMAGLRILCNGSAFNVFIVKWRTKWRSCNFRTYYSILPTKHNKHIKLLFISFEKNYWSALLYWVLSRRKSDEGFAYDKYPGNWPCFPGMIPSVFPATSRSSNFLHRFENLKCVWLLPPTWKFSSFMVGHFTFPDY